MRCVNLQGTASHAKTAKVINMRPLTCWTPHENSCKYLKIAAKEI